MKVLFTYNNNYYFNDKLSNFIRNTELAIVYIDEYPLQIMQKLHNANNLILYVCSLENTEIQDGDYSLANYGIFINNGKVVRIEEDNAFYNPIHKNNFRLSFKNSHINYKIIWNNILFYNKFILLFALLLMIISHSLFGNNYSVNMAERANMLKQIK